MSSPPCPSKADPVPASVHLSRFESKLGVEEIHLTVRPLEEASVEEQVATLTLAYHNALANEGWDMDTAVFRRVFCADPASLADVIRTSLEGEGPASPCATSWVGQPPSEPAHVVLWAYHVRDPKQTLTKAWDGQTLTLRRDDHLHHWTTNLACPEAGSVEDQTRGLFHIYAEALADRGLTLADHVTRTWLYVQDIDTHYPAMAEARRALFQEQGLTPDTHYIASTGIEGRGIDPRARVCMDGYAISRLEPGQIRHLKASDHLSPTDLYGVTFERGTAITYPDRTHVTISGTASIDERGAIVYPGDLPRQMDRTLENIEALLTEAGTGLEAMQIFTVYLRHDSDRPYAEWRMRERFADTPIVVVTGRVCRPGWLIEIEGEALFTT